MALGRNSDLVEVAGKRASLADITRRLCAVPGVEDAVAFQPDGAAAGVANRVAAVVVSRGVSAREIAAQLAASLDAVFLPRPLVLVERIPRDAVGQNVSRAAAGSHACPGWNRLVWAQFHGPGDSVGVDQARLEPLLRGVQAVELENQISTAHVAEQRQERSPRRQPIAQLLFDIRQILAVA